MILQWESRKRTVTFIAGRHASAETEIAFLAAGDSSSLDVSLDEPVEPDSGTMTEPLDFGLRYSPPPQVYTPADEFMEVVCGRSVSAPATPGGVRA